MQYRPGTCRDCGAQYKLPISFKADKAKCKACGGVVEVGAAVAAPSKAKPEPKQEEEFVEHRPSGKKSKGPSMKERLMAERQAAAAAAAKPAGSKAPAKQAGAPKTAAPKAGAKKPVRKAPARPSRARAGQDDGDEAPKRPARGGARRGAGSGSRSSARRAGRGGRGRGDDEVEEDGEDRPRRGRQQKKSPVLGLVLSVVVVAGVGGAAWWKLSNPGTANASYDERVASSSMSDAIKRSLKLSTLRAQFEEKAGTTLSETQAAVFEEHANKLFDTMIDAEGQPKAEAEIQASLQTFLDGGSGDALARALLGKGPLGDMTLDHWNDGKRFGDDLTAADAATEDDVTDPAADTPTDDVADAGTPPADETPAPAPTAEVTEVTDPADLPRNAKGLYKIVLFKNSNSESLNEKILKKYPDALYDVFDPAETKLENLEPFPRFEGTVDEDWATIQEDVALMVANEGARSARAQRRIEEQYDPRHAVPAILNAMLQLNYVDGAESRTAEACLQTLGKVVKRKFGWSYHVNEPNKAAIANRRSVAQLHSLWTRILSGEKDWESWYNGGRGAADADRDSADELGG